MIVSDSGALAERVKDGEHGFTFPAGNAEKLTEAIKLFIANPGLQQKLAEQVPGVKDMKKHAEEIVSVYNSIILPEAL